MPPHLRPRSLDARTPRSLVDVTPTETQRRVIEGDRRALLILGDAGHGKTTLALLVLAERWRRARGPFRALVVVPTEGLRALIADALVELGVPKEVARVRTYDRWALREARRAFSDLPRRTSHDATPAVMRLKRDPALRPSIATIAARAPGRIDDDHDAPVVENGACAQRGDLQHLFGDAALLADVVARSPSGVPRHAIEETIAHTKVQFAQRAEAAFSYVTDRAKLAAVDGAKLDVGTPTADAGSIDAEDAAVLFAIDRARAERWDRRAARPRRVDCLVLDEAQELAALELDLLARALRPGGTLVVAGDADQHLGRTARFAGWPATMRALGADEHESVVLDHGFRCPPSVVRFARTVRDGGALDAVSSSSDGDVVVVARDADPARWLDDELPRLKAADDGATVAILTRDDGELRALAAQSTLRIPIARDGRFPKRGPVLARVDQTRGLEVDVVIVPALSRYRDQPDDRRALYVAATRARHQLVVFAR